MDLEFLDEALIALQGKIFLFTSFLSSTPYSVVFSFLPSSLSVFLLSSLLLLFPPTCQPIILCLLPFFWFSSLYLDLQFNFSFFPVFVSLSQLLSSPLTESFVYFTSSLCRTLHVVVYVDSLSVVLCVVRSIHVSGAPGGAERGPQ